MRKIKQKNGRSRIARRSYPGAALMRLPAKRGKEPDFRRQDDGKSRKLATKLKPNRRPGQRLKCPGTPLLVAIEEV